MAEDIFHVRLTAESRRVLRDFAEETGADLGCRPVVRRTAEGLVVEAYLPEEAARVAQARRGAVRVEIVENFSEESRQRRQEVSRGNRYAARGAIPRGLGRKE